MGVWAFESDRVLKYISAGQEDQIYTVIIVSENFAFIRIDGHD